MHKGFSIIFLFALTFFSCTNMEKRKVEHLKRKNQKLELIHRHSNETFFAEEKLQPKEREIYPWEKKMIGNLPRITKEFFQCRGSYSNPEKKISDSRGGQTSCYDCGGLEKHSLPVIDGKEVIPQILIDLLNYVQERTDHRVVITCGHRCPVHNTYADASTANQKSKHQVGAEADFYVEGMEDRIDEVLYLLLDFYQQDAHHPEFQRFAKVDRHVGGDQIVAYANREVEIRLFGAKQGRDLDNRHPYPYIAIQVKMDRETGHRLEYSWHSAHNNYMRY
ncbi:MAG: hypothetical protein S4CHLAM102_04240 [Chlamydiia bacterium]|nr:hypothetical protein [Chlamydiia bacterium]